MGDMQETLENKGPNDVPALQIGCGGWIRTSDLQVMSLTSYRAAPPRGQNGIKLLGGTIFCKGFHHKTGITTQQHPSGEPVRSEHKSECSTP